MMIAQIDSFALATTVMTLLMASVAAILLVTALVGISRNRALRSGSRVAWVIATIAIPIFGPVAYLLLAPRTVIRGASEPSNTG